MRKRENAKLNNGSVKENKKSKSDGLNILNTSFIIMTDVKKTICLAMIVKNEAHLIIETFRHLKEFITFDYWVINDNGSTDGTQDLIRAYFAEEGIPGELDETPWRDFAYNRTIVFEKAYQKTDYAFVWDADDEITGDFKLPDNLTADYYRFTFGNSSGLRYSRCQLFSNHKKWCYIGVLHETPSCLESVNHPVDVTGNYYFISGRRGNRSKDPEKYKKDALLLEGAFQESFEKKDSLYPRYAFYTAQSYNCCGMYEKAIEYYKKVLTLPNWSEEKYVSCIQIYDAYQHLQKEEEGLRFLVESVRHNKKRVEGIYRLIKYYGANGLHNVAYAYYTLIQDMMEHEGITHKMSNYLFVKKEEYDFYLPYYMIIVSERTKRMDTFIRMYQLIFKQCYLHTNTWHVQNLFHNLQFGLSHLPTDDSFLESLLTYRQRLYERNLRLKPEQEAIIDRVIQHYLPSDSPIIDTILKQRATQINSSTL